jgi:hypothetical protein
MSIVMKKTVLRARVPCPVWFSCRVNFSMKIFATKARRLEGFIYKKTFCAPLCLSVFVAIFMVGMKKDAHE